MPRLPAMVFLCLLTVCVAVLGCGRQRTFEPTYPVSGTVTLDHKPLADGVIAFLTPETGDLQALPIKDGKYQGEVRAGKRRVEIRAYPPQKGPMGPMDPPPVNYLPARYNVESKLTTDVTPQGPNSFQFNLASK